MLLVNNENKVKSQRTQEVLRGRNILCFSHDWTGDPLSKTHLMRVLSKDNRILWINAIANRMPTASTKDVKRIFIKLKRFTEPVKEVEPNIFVLSPLAIPTYGSSLVRGFNQRFLLSQVKKAMRNLGFENPLNMVFNPAAGLLAGKLNESEIIYYCVDDYTEFTGVAKGLKEIEQELFQKADLVIVSAEKLFDDKKKYNENTHIIRHGTDWRHFRKSLDDATEIPAEIKDLPKPIIGFHGLLADWVDYELIKKIAEKYKNGSVVLIGKIAVDAEQKVKVLDNVKNVYFLGRKPYETLPNYCKGFDVTLNPFIINNLTLAANPLKVREYLAAGLQTISTDIPEVRILKHCLVGENHEHFIEQIENALNNPIDKEIISDEIKHESWDAKVDELRAVIEKTRGQRKGEMEGQGEGAKGR
ncbi:MAG: glycosyltransferase [Aridibacter sp.]